MMASMPCRPLMRAANHFISTFYYSTILTIKLWDADEQLWLRAKYATNMKNKTKLWKRNGTMRMNECRSVYVKWQ